VAALRDVRGEAWFGEMINHGGEADTIKKLLDEELGEVGFAFLGKRIKSYQNPEVMREFLRELGTRIQTPVKMMIGGSAALMLEGLFVQRIDAIEIVDEIPQAIRSDQVLLMELQERFELRLAHFQSHYLPDGWSSRIKSLGRFGVIEAFVVEEYDIALGKLFSKRTKDLDDLLALKGSLDGSIFEARLKNAGSALLQPDLRQNAEKNWYILFGTALPA
jgi:hypothetical protein